MESELKKPNFIVDDSCRNRNRSKPKPLNVKPVTFITGQYGDYYGHNNFKELMLLKALRVTSDPKVLMQMTGIKRFTELTRTFDKISNRKEYNSALQELGMDFKWVAKGLKTEAETGDKSADRIKAFQIILKSLGLDKYEEVQGDSSDWESLILKASESTIKNDSPALSAPAPRQYDVNVPEIPESMKKMREKEDKRGKEFYE